MANNCQMMCVMKAESVLWSLRSHPFLTDLIGYANEGQSETVSDSNLSAYTLLAFRTFMAAHTHRISLNPNPVLIFKKKKKTTFAGFDRGASHAQREACEESPRWWVLVARSVSTPTQRDSQSAINRLASRGQGPRGKEAQRRNSDLRESLQTWQGGRVLRRECLTLLHLAWEMFYCGWFTIS